MDQIIISLDVTSLFKNLPSDIIRNTIVKRWNLIKNFTKVPLQEFHERIELFMKNTFFRLIMNTIIKFLVLQWGLPYPQC